MTNVTGKKTKINVAELNTILLYHPDIRISPLTYSLIIRPIRQPVEHHDHLHNPFRPELLEHALVFDLAVMVLYKVLTGGAIMDAVMTEYHIHI